MKRDAGMCTALVCCEMLLIAAACSAAAAVTHGDLMLSSGFGQAFHVQVHSPSGKLKASMRLKSCANVWGRAVSQDGRYAIIGCESNAQAGSTTQPQKKVVFIQLKGASPKILGIKTLGMQGFFDPATGKSCGPFIRNSIALKSRVLPGGAGAALDIYISVSCPLSRTPYLGCRYLSIIAITSAVQQWSITHKSFRALSPIMVGERAAFVDNAVKCATHDGFEGGSMVVTADGKVYATFAFNTGSAFFHDTIGIYEVRRHPRLGTRLVPTSKFKMDSVEIFGFMPSGPATGCGFAAPRAPVGFRTSKLAAYAKGRAPYVGGIRTGDDIRSSYKSCSCRGATTYATVGTTVDFETGAEATFNRILKVSIGELRKGATGRIVFNTPSSVPNISIVP